MPYNTGRKIYNTLKQVYVDNGVPTGVADKTNDPVDPDYIPPVMDPTTCPPSTIPPTPINKVEVQIINSTTQVVVLDNLICRGSTITDLSKAYVNRSSFSSYPGSTSVFATADQLDDISKLLAVASALSKGIRIHLKIEYKSATDGSYTEVGAVDLQLTNSCDVNFNTIRIPGSGTNTIRITMTDNPIPVPPPNVPPVVNVGVDLTIKLPTNSVTLTATATDTDGTVVSTQWTQVSGPSTAVIGSPSSLSSLMSGLIQGMYVFKMTATDNEGGVGSDTVFVTVQPADPNPNGIVNLYVDAAMPDTTNAISQVTLQQIASLTSIDLLTTPINKSNGVVQKTPLKGTYNIEIEVVVNAGARSIEVNWGMNNVVIEAATSGVYTVQDVVVDEGVNGVVINYRATSTGSTVPLLYARLTASTPMIESQALLPFGLQEIGRGDVTVAFYSDSAGTIPAAFTGKINYNNSVHDNMASVIVNNGVTKSITALESVVIETVQSFKRWDYTLNNPSVAEVDDKVEDLTYMFSLLNGQGYLIIP